jgi:hypothetical protein
MSKTGILLIIVSCILAIYDLCAFVFGGIDATISRFLLSAGIVAPAIPLSIGIIIGHIFGRMKLYCDNCHQKLTKDNFHGRT